MKIKVMDYASVQHLLPERDPESHKGNYGKILLLCGSRGYTGAAALAAMGALRTGAGLVYLAVPESIYEIEAVKLTEAIVMPLNDENGMLSVTALPQVRQLMKDKDAVLIGPGLGQSEGVLQTVETILREFEGPVVLDADGINIMQQHMDLLRGRTHPTVLTPHSGEFMRVAKELTGDRVVDASLFAGLYGCCIALKGHRTVITDGSLAYINHTGNPGMAVGGSGDLLSGMIASLLGQGIPILEATACAVWLHGAAGDLCAEELGQYAMLPSDMLDVLPRLLK